MQLYLAAYLLTLTYAKTSDAGTDLTIIRRCLPECMRVHPAKCCYRLYDVSTGACCECCEFELVSYLHGPIINNAPIASGFLRFSKFVLLALRRLFSGYGIFSGRRFAVRRPDPLSVPLRVRALRHPRLGRLGIYHRTQVLTVP